VVNKLIKFNSENSFVVECLFFDIVFKNSLFFKLLKINFASYLKSFHSVRKYLVSS